MDTKKVEAFLSRKCPDIFHCIEHTNDIWRPDPFDVASLHEDARATFARLVEQARDGRVPSGRILVIRGEAGSGKTHLMRAFRNQVHEENSAFFAYMQMTTSSPNYERYILQNVVNSLQQPYRAGQTKTSLQVLSDRLVSLLPAKRVEALREAAPGIEAAPIVHELADRLVDRNDLPQVDPDLIRALLFLQLGRQSVTIKVNKYLRAESLSDYDRDVLGGIAPLHAEDAPLNHVRHLATLIRTPLNRAFVVCMDQLEDIFNLDAAKERFPRAMSAVASIAELPSVVVVVSCLEQFYVEMKQYLTHSIIHRLEQDPEPQSLRGMRSQDEAKQVITRRLDHLWSECGLEPSPDDIAPFPSGFLDRVAGRSSRAILLECLEHRQRCVQAGKLVELTSTVPSGGSDPEPSSVIDTTQLSQAWNDRLTSPHDVPEDEADLRKLLLDVLPLVAGDFAGAAAPRVKPGDAPNALSFEASWAPQLHLAVTEAAPQGGALMRQMKAAAKVAEDTPLVLVRSSVFSRSPTAMTMKELGKITARGGRGVIVSDSDWRAMVAFVAFHEEHRQQRAYAKFRRESKPLWRLGAIQEILDAAQIDTSALDQVSAVDELSASSEPRAPVDERTSPRVPSGARVNAATSGDSGSARGEAATPTTPPDARELPLTEPMLIGTTQGHRASNVTLDPNDMRRHAAFLGSTGSGKTTAAMAVIEQLLARQVPAILVDRKGDLCGYGLPNVWTDPVDDAERGALRDRLRSLVDVRVYTPGDTRGRHLSVPLVPADLRELAEDEIESAASNAASGVAAMLGYGNGQAHKAGTVAIAKAIEFLAEVGEVPSLEAIIELLSEPDEAFVAKLGAPLIRFCDKTVTDLEILKASKSLLSSGKGESLDIDGMLRPTTDGRVPLSIVSTKFLSSDSDVQFWVAQLLIQLGRWLDKNPSDELQGVILLDEADLYLPATRSPASKQPVEHLLRRARSKGFGVLLATQSPGDLDYKCRDNIVTWWVGLIAQTTALKKLEPMFRDTHLELGRLASQKIGEFHLVQEGHVRSIRSRRNAVPLPSQVADEEILRLARGER